MKIRNVAEQEKTQADMAARANAAKLGQKATFFGSPYPDGIYDYLTLSFTEPV